MLSISIRYGGKLNYAMRALGPMLGNNSSQIETALSQMLGHDGASRHTLLSKMLRHNSARTQDHSNTSIGLRQRTCAAVCDMFLGKNHGSHFITIKSIGKTHHPVPLRFAVNGSASARYASLPSTLATTRRRDNSARQSPQRAMAELHVNAVQHAIIGVACQNPAAPGQQRHPRLHLHLHLYLHPPMLRPLRRHSRQRRHPVPETPQHRIAQSPTAPKR